jgi:hypothetical protein
LKCPSGRSDRNKNRNLGLLPRSWVKTLWTLQYLNFVLPCKLGTAGFQPKKPRLAPRLRRSRRLRFAPRCREAPRSAGAHGAPILVLGIARKCPQREEEVRDASGYYSELRPEVQWLCLLCRFSRSFPHAVLVLFPPPCQLSMVLPFFASLDNVFVSLLCTDLQVTPPPHPVSLRRAIRSNEDWQAGAESRLRPKSSMTRTSGLRNCRNSRSEELSARDWARVLSIVSALVNRTR